MASTITPVSHGANSYLLFIELGSVSFKASLVPKDHANRIMLDHIEEPEKHKNLLGLYAYTNTDLFSKILPEAINWFNFVKNFARNRQPILPTNEVLVIATAALRDLRISNNRFVIGLEKAVADIFGTNIHILDGFIEAQLLTAAFRSILAPNDKRVIFDLGGASLEIVCIEPDSTHFTSLQIGAGRITANLVLGNSLNAVMQNIEKQFGEKCATIKTLAPQVWYGVGGVANAFQRVFKLPASESIFRDKIGQEFQRFTKKILGKDGILKPNMRKSELRQLMEAAPVDLGPHRRKIYAGGLLVTEAMCQHFSITAMRIHEGDLRSGLLRFLDFLRPSPFTP